MEKNKMFAQLRIIFTVMFGITFIAGCSSMPSPEGKPLPDLTFHHIKQLNLPVSEIVIDDSALDRNVQRPQLFIAPFNRMVSDYVRHKFKAQGGRHILKVVVEEASVTDQSEPAENRVARFLDVAGTEIYDVDLTLHIIAMDLQGGEKGVRLSAERQIKISEHSSVADREERQIAGLEAMFEQLDVSVTRVVLQDLGLYETAQDQPTFLYDDEAPSSPARNGVIVRQEL